MVSKSRKVDDRPSMQFYPKDCLSDVGLQSCSYQAKGLWFDLLCYMWFAPERGKLEKATIQKLCKSDTNVIEAIIKELVNNGVCDVGENHALICRKMNNEYLMSEAISEKRKQAANARWHTKGNTKHHAKHASPSPSPSPSPNTVNTNTDTEANASVPKILHHAKPKTPQAEFMEAWGSLYKNETGQEYKADKKDFILIASLIKKFSKDKIIEKAKLLYRFCQNRLAWFTKRGMADFTIGKLSSKWNELIEGGDIDGKVKHCGISKSEYEQAVQGRE